MADHLFSLDGIHLKDTWLTIGSFDGVHRGHQQIIKELTNSAQQVGGISVVLTFHPHPSVILRGRKGNFYLTTVTEKVSLLDQLGVDLVITHPFTEEVSQSPARDFISYLKNHLDFKQLWVGEDFALGKGREGNSTFLQQHQEEYDYQIHIVPPIKSEGRVISSSVIRNLLSEGKVEEANLLLGRNYKLSGIVVHGDGRGKTIGIPTANLDTGTEKLVPASGVYACRVQVMDRQYPAAVNIGIRPTFESTDLKAHIEAHILDFSQDLYSEQVSIEFLLRLRGEQRFSSVEELINQVHRDIERTREIVTVEI
jgi:riboflavin kinase/FMN adenylyltransferase